MAPTDGYPPPRAGDGGEPVATPDENRDAPAHPEQVTVRPTRPRALSIRHGEQVPVSVLLAVGCGGIVGAISRYLVQVALPTAPGRFPTSTFVINLSGSALFSFLLVVINDRFADRRLARPLLGTGLIGAYTTFSAFSVEAVLLARGGQLVTAVTYVTLTVIFGLCTALLGMGAGRLSMRALTGAVEAER